MGWLHLHHYLPLQKDSCLNLIRYLHQRKIDHHIKGTTYVTIFSWHVQLVSIVIYFYQNLKRSISSWLQLGFSLNRKSFFSHMNLDPISWRLFTKVCNWFRVLHQYNPYSNIRSITFNFKSFIKIRQTKQRCIGQLIFQ